MGIESWSKTPASNNSAPPNGAPEGMSPASFNDIIRQQMADHRTQWEQASWFNWGDTCTYASGTSFTVSGDVTSRYTIGRRIWVNGATPGDIYGTITNSVYSAPNTTVTISFDSGSMSNETLTVYLSIIDPSTGSVREFASGTVMVFYQAAAPTGWTQDASNDDMALRVVDGVGGGTGGTHDLSSPPSTAHTHTGPSHTHSTPNHSHTPTVSSDSHNHKWYNYTSNGNSDQSYDSSGTAFNLDNNGSHSLNNTSEYYIASSNDSGSSITDAWTSNDNHTHTVTISGDGSGTSGAGGTGETGSTSPTAFAPKYIDVIVCEKD